MIRLVIAVGLLIAHQKENPFYICAQVRKHVLEANTSGDTFAMLRRAASGRTGSGSY